MQVKKKACKNRASEQQNSKNHASNLVHVCIHLHDCFQVACKYFNSSIRKERIECVNEVLKSFDKISLFKLLLFYKSSKRIVPVQVFSLWFQVTIPGTHNSGAKFNLEKSFLCLPQACACQTMSIERQLQSGVRFLDIRLHHRNDKFRINHAVVDLGLSFDDVIHAVRKFLRSNGREAIVMRYREEGEADDVTRSFEDTLMESCFLFTQNKSKILNKILVYDLSRRSMKPLIKASRYVYSSQNYVRSTLNSTGNYIRLAVNVLNSYKIYAIFNTKICKICAKLNAKLCMVCSECVELM